MQRNSRNGLLAVMCLIAYGATARADFVNGVLVDQRVAIYSKRFKTFVTAEAAGATNVASNRTLIGDWETFRLFRYSNGDLAFRSFVSNGVVGNYLRAPQGAQGNAPLDVQGISASTWEQIRLEKRNPVDNRNPAIPMPNSAFDSEFGLYVVASCPGTPAPNCRKYIRATGGVTNGLVPDRSTIGLDEVFELYWLDRILGGDGTQTYNNQTISLFAELDSQSASKYICAENGATWNLQANRPQSGLAEVYTPGAWESFAIDDRASDGSIAIRSMVAANGGNTYLRSEPSTREVKPNASASNAERFVLMQLTDNVFALRSRTSGDYLAVGSDGVLRTNVFQITSAARFQIAWKAGDLYDAMTAFARTFNPTYQDRPDWNDAYNNQNLTGVAGLQPVKVKKLGKGWLALDEYTAGLLFHTEFVINGKLWLYEAFPSNERYPYYQKYVHVWNGVVLTGDMIGAEITVQPINTSGIWQPPIPRTPRKQPVGVYFQTPHTDGTGTGRLRNHQLAPCPPDKPECTNPAFEEHYGSVYPPIMVDLSDSQSMENMGWRWVVEVGVGSGPERWAIDLGPKVGVYNPRYGVVGYHNGDHSWCGSDQSNKHDCFQYVEDDKRFFTKIQSLTVRPDRHYPEPAIPIPPTPPAPSPACTTSGDNRCCNQTMCPRLPPYEIQ